MEGGAVEFENTTFHEKKSTNISVACQALLIGAVRYDERYWFLPAVGSVPW